MIKAILVSVLCFCSGIVEAGQEHWNTRIAIAKLQASITGMGEILMLGDSITEQFWWNTIKGRRILNGGQGGAGIDQVIETADALLPAAKPKIVVLMVGVNDCVRGSKTSASLWGAKYQALLDKIHAAGAVPIALSILPVERNSSLSLGHNYFSTDCIIALNAQWRDAVSSRGEVYVDLNSVFGVPPAYHYMRPGWTVDGVHLSKVGSENLYKRIGPAIEIALNRAPR